MEALEVFEAYVVKVKNEEEAYDSEKLRRLLREFADPMVQHLKDEVRSRLEPRRSSSN